MIVAAAIMLTVLLGQSTAAVSQAALSAQDEPLSVPSVNYPADAKAARIQGTVQIEIDVDATGHVTGVNALSGPVPLRQAAVDAYSRAVYRPLLVQGHPARAVIKTSVRFQLDELPPNTDQLVEAQFQPMQARCQRLAEQKDAEALAACRQALEMTSHFITPGFDLEAHATAYNDVVLMLMAEGKKSKSLPEARMLANRAVDLVGLTVHDNPHTPAVAIAYITRCEVLSLAGDLQGAGSDCAIAEETLTTLLHDYPENERSANYRVQLRETLELHAIVAERDHHPLEARRLRSRAHAI